MAEALFREQVKSRGDFEVQSAGVSAWPGQPASAETLKILKSRGIDLSDHQSQPVTEELLAQSTHIFAMTSAHLGMLLSEFPEVEDKAFLAGEFTDVQGVGIGADIPDPFGMSGEAYQAVASVLDEVIPSLVAYIEQTDDSSK